MVIDPITIAFVALTLLVAVGLRLGKKTPLREIGGIAVSMGMLGTFFGILLALLGFDTNNIEQSVPSLINGMKLAFVTSVFGVGVAVVLRVMEAVQAPPQPAGTPSPAVYLALMQQQSEHLETLVKQSAKLDRIAEHLGGVGDSSITTQLQKLRMDLKDFASEVSKSSTDAIVESLKSVVENFNQNLTTQFGENFKELNTAVGRLLDWMEHHKTIVDETQNLLGTVTEAQRTAATQLVQTAQTLSNVETSLKSIQSNMKGIANNLGDISSKVGGLAGHGQRMTEILATLAENNKLLTQLIGELSHVLGVAPKSLVAVEDALKKVYIAAQKIEHTVEQIEARHQKLVEDVTASMAEIHKQNAEDLQKQMRDYEAATEKALSEAMSKLGGGMATLSGKFVDDYGLLTEKLRDVVRIANDLDQRRNGRG